MQKDIDENKKGHLWNKKVSDAFKNAVNGIFACVISEKNIRIEMIIAIIAIIAGTYMNIPTTELICVLATIFIVVFAEMMNTAIEYVVDMITDKYNNMAKMAKDTAAGAVLTCTTGAIIVSYIVFGQRLIKSGIELFKNVQVPKYIGIILLVLVFAILVFKEFICYKYKIKIHISGQVTIAFAFFTYTLLSIKDITVISFFLFLACIIFFNRANKKNIEISGAILGTILGIFITLILFLIIRNGNIL